MRGEFRRADGLVMPNNISLAGARMILSAALRDTSPVLYLGLVKGFPSPAMKLHDMVEPTVGVNGYQRIQITRNIAGWPTLSVSGNEAFAATDWIQWNPAGDFDQAINRCALFDTNVVNPDNDILALSAALPTPIVLTSVTDLAMRQFQYRVYI